MGKIIQAATRHNLLIIRFILFLVFIGHGLISLGESPSMSIHYNILSAVNFFNLDPGKVLTVMGWFDIGMGVLVLFRVFPLVIYPFIIFYLMAVGISAWFLYYQKTSSAFGLAEMFRRLTWVFLAWYLWNSCRKERAGYYLLRFAIAFAFLAHGTASLGLLGFSGVHIELAAQWIPEPYVKDFVFYSGISDTILGIILLSGFFSRYAAIFGIFWLIFVVILSFTKAYPDGVFRLGFLLLCIYVAIDPRCHDWKTYPNEGIKTE